MALETFEPSLQPSPGTGRKTKFNLLKAEFGEGYTQTARNGINHRRRELSLTWEVLTDDQAWQISGFFDEQGGDRPFWYVPPRESVAIRWTCEEYDDTVNTDGTRKITATLIQSLTNET